MSESVCLTWGDAPRLPRSLNVRRLNWDWNDPSKTVREEILRRKEISPDRCFYLNPMFEVTCPEPAAEFFREARGRQREWSRVLTRQFGSANWRRISVTMDAIERRMTFSGIMFIDGGEVDPGRQYLLEADYGLHPEVDIVLARRPQANACLKERDWGALAELSRFELESQLFNSPLDPVYVLPGITVMGFRPNGAFCAEVLRRSREWHRRLCRLLESSGYRRLKRRSDWKTKILVLHGVLAINGMILHPGHWPKQSPPNSEAVPTWSTEFAVPPGMLGLSPTPLHHSQE